MGERPIWLTISPNGRRLLFNCTTILVAALKPRRIFFVLYVLYSIGFEMLVFV